MLVLAVSYDTESLNQRISAFQAAGHVVLPASSLKSCLSVIAFNSYDLLVIGATVPFDDRKQIVLVSRREHPGSKIISVEYPGAEQSIEADYMVPAGDEVQLMNTVLTLGRKLA